MPLDTLPQVIINRQIKHAYQEPGYYVDGLEDAVSLREMLEYLLENTGSGSGGSDSFVVSANLEANNTLRLTRNTGQLIDVDLAVLAGDEHVDNVELVGANLVVTFADNTTDVVDLSGLQDGGEVNTAANVGGGAEVFRDKTGVTLNLRTLVGAGGVNVSEDGDTVQIDGSGIAGSGESNTAANVGGGAEVFRDKTGVTLNLRTLVGAGGVSVSEDGDTVQIDGSGIAGGGGLEKYQAGNEGDPLNDGAYITATAIGATYSRSGGSGQNTEGTITLPADCFLTGISVHFTSAQAPGNTFYLNVDFPTTAEPNNALDSLMPPIGTVTSKPVSPNDATPAQNYAHSGTPLLIGVAGVSSPSAGVTRVRVKVANYNQQVGSNASILSLMFP